MKEFNVTGVCVPDKHYMVNTEQKLFEIMEMAHKGQYFIINRARQYGKTTTLVSLSKILNVGLCTCIYISFEGVGESMFKDEESFCTRFQRQLFRVLKRTNPTLAAEWNTTDATDFDELGDCIDVLCRERRVFLIIDEVDAASNNLLFLSFLGMLRKLYLERDSGGQNTFHSVILAGVHDIKNIKLKLVKEGKSELKEGERQYNSPWNIATDFKVDMSFSPADITTMLIEYEEDHHTGMDIHAISHEIYDFTGGYPYLTSRICKYIDEELGKNWTISGVHEAVKIVTAERNTLFDDLLKNLESYKELYDLLYLTVIKGRKRQFSILSEDINIAVTFGYIKRIGNRVAVSNKIFEMVLSNHFISEDEKKEGFNPPVGNGLYKEITSSGSFNMELCLRKFAEYYNEIFTTRNISFLEEHGAIIFLSFLKPLVNGSGFYHIESQLIDNRRMDIVVDYGNEQFIIELKLWRGDAYHAKAYDQLIGYMKAKSAVKGYLVTFDLRKEGNKKQKSEWVKIGDRQIFEVIV